MTNFRPSRLLAAALLLCGAGTAFAQYDNDELESQITAMGVAHNVAFPVSLSPEPISAFAAGATAYSFNLGLKYTPPVLVAPGTVGAFPNTADGCGYVLTINGEPAKTRQDFLGLLQSFDDDFLWSEFLGAPDVYHVNTDVAVSVHRGGEGDAGRLDGSVTLPVGSHALRWRGQTLVTPILDYPPWFALLAKPVEAASKRAVIGLKTPPARRAAMRALIELAINLGIEGATFGLDWYVLDGVPTPAGDFDIANEQFQTVRIYDTTTPVFNVSQPSFTVEATQVGGEFLRDHIAALRNGFEVTDTCDRRPIVNYSGPPFLPVGETTDIRWTARDTGPVDIDGGWNEAGFVQRITVQDTKPPILLPPPGHVIESDSTTSPELGNPGVFDLADVRPVVENDAPASFAPDSRTLVEWTATDKSGNSTSRNQWITVKAPGSNTAPLANAMSVNALMFEPTVIELGGIDNDLLSGRYDQLSFAISEAPANGFFVAPLFPYFIEDHRVENEFGLNKFELADFLDAECAADPNNYVPPIDFVTEPRYITVDDDGVTYVSDKYMVCSRSGGSIERKNRIARFVRGADNELELTAQIDTSNNAPDTLSIGADGTIFFRGTPRDASNETVRACDPGLSACLVYNIAVDTSINNPDRLFPNKRLTAMVGDDNGVLYVTDGRLSLVAYDLRNIGGSNRPVLLGNIAGVGDLQDGGFDQKDLAIDSAGNLYLSDVHNDRVYKFSASTTVRNDDGSVEFTPGELIGWKGRCDTNLTEFRACDEVADTSFGYTCTTERCGVSETGGSAPGQFDEPKGIAIDANDVLYVTDFNNFRVQRFTPLGYFAGEAESECDGSCFVLGDFGKPQDISANLRFFYVLDEERDLLHVFETTPITDFDDDTLTPTQTARVTYQSDEGFKGIDAFTFTVSDGLASSAPATVSINVARNQRPPIATANQVFEGIEDEMLEFRLGAFDPDPDDQPILTYRIEEEPANGSLSGTGPDLMYTPDPDFNGVDSFVFTVSDGVARSEPAEARIEVEAVNDLPTLTFADMADRFGAGFPIKVEVTLNDVDLADTHVYGIDWGPGEPFASGRALPPGQVAPEGEPSFVQSADGVAVLVDEATYFSNGSRTITVCASDAEGVAALSGCSDPRVTVVATRTVGIESMVRKAITIRDNAPTETDALGNEWPTPIVDGEPFTAVFTLHNVEPNDVATVLDATNVAYTIRLEPGLRLTSNGLLAVTGDALGASCTTSAREVSCTAESIPSGGQLGVGIEVVGDGSIVGEVEVPVVAMATSEEADHGGMVGNARGFPLSMNPDGDADGDGVANRNDAFPGDATESADFDLDGLGDNADRDDDNDGLHDNWEQRFGFDPRDPADAVLDADADGLSNGQEFDRGSRPDVGDSDFDGVADADDNCPVLPNANQHDGDADGQGDACDPGYAAAVASLGDLNGDGTADFALLAVDGGQQRVFVKDGATDDSIGANVIDLGAVAAGTVRSLDASGSRLAVLVIAPDGSSRLEAYDAQTGSRVYAQTLFDSSFTPGAMIAVAGEIWIAARQDDGTVSVQRRDAAGGGDLGTLGFGRDRQVLGLARAGSGEVVLLAIDEVSGELLAEARAPSSAEVVSTTIAGGADTLTAHVASTGSGFVVVAQSTAGEVLATLWSADGAAIGAFPVLEPTATLLAALMLPADAAAARLAVLARETGSDTVIRVYDTSDGQDTGGRVFGSGSLSFRGAATAGNEAGVLLAAADTTVTFEIAAADQPGAPVRRLTASSSLPPAPPPDPDPAPPAPAPNPGPPAGGSGGGGSTGWLLLCLLLPATLFAVRNRRVTWTSCRRYG